MGKLNEFILSIDQSTSGTKAILVGQDGHLVCRQDLPHKQLTNSLGWIEHDPKEIWANTCEAAREVIITSGVSPEQVKAIAISNQRETAVCWQRSTGKPLCNAITWQCARATSVVEEIRTPETEALVYSTTGLHLSPYFSAAKFSWMIRNVDGVYEAQKKKDICFGTIDAWLVFCMTGGSAFKTDVSNASRTQLLNLDTIDWDDRMLGLFGIDKDSLPEVCESNELYGYSDLGGIFDPPIPICGVMGDSQAALLGNGCLSPGEAKITLGTGTSVMVNTGSKRKLPDCGVVESIGWKLNGSLCYVLEGNINYTGALIVWLKNNLGIIERSRDVGKIATSVEDNGGVYIVPAFSGLGSPYWKSDARAVICGMSTNSDRRHIVRAAEEAIAYQILDIFADLCSVCGDIPRVYADGGAKNDVFLMQFIADMLSTEILPSDVEELSAMGACYASMLYLRWIDEEWLRSREHSKSFSPQMDIELRKKNYSGWKRAISMLL